MRSAYFPALVVVLLVAPGITAQSALNPRELVLNVSQEHVTWDKLGVTRPDGRRETRARQARVLKIDARLMGFGQAEHAEIEWFIIGKEPGGTFDYYSRGASAITIPRTDAAHIQILCEPLQRGEGVARPYLTSASVARGARGVIAPEGWIVRVLQEGKILSTRASRPGLLEWMARNPPPRR